MVHGIPVPQPGVKPVSPTLGAGSLNWTTREVPPTFIYFNRSFSRTHVCSPNDDGFTHLYWQLGVSKALDHEMEVEISSDGFWECISGNNFLVTLLSPFPPFRCPQ